MPVSALFAPAVRRWIEIVRPLLLFGTFALLWLSSVRAGLAVWQWPRLSDSDIASLFLVGMRLDLALLGYLLALPLLTHMLLPSGSLRRLAVAALLTLASLFVLFMELATPAFMAEYDGRPDRIFFEYLIYPREVFSMLWSSHTLWLLALPPLLLLFTLAAWRFWRRQLSREPSMPYVRRALALGLLLPALLIAARGLDHRPLNLSAASFSSNHVANQLAQNSSFSLAQAVYSLRHEVDAAQLYGSMPFTEVVARVRRYTGVPDSAFIDPRLPSLHRQPGAYKPPRPLNLVILIEESLGAPFVGRLGGLPLTPNLDRLSQEGLWFTHMYATGTRTARGMEAVAAGFPPTPAQPVLKLPRAQGNFFTLGALLRQRGYATEFIYGGVANFDNMRGFYLANGFQRVIEEKDFDHPVLRGSWGVSDEDWVSKAHETFVAHGDQPFFGLMLSTSNHEPYEFPEGRIAPYEQPLHTRHNAMKYADYAIGRFFELARQADYFEHTVFVVVADHDARVYGESLLPVEHFRIPALIIGPGLQPQSYDTIASQIDLAPTLLHLLGIDAAHPMIGRDLLALAPGDPGRALMQFGSAHGFRVGNRLIVQQPHRPPQSFELDAADHLRPAPPDPELARDALAHVLWASEAYRRQLHRLPRPSAG